MTVQKAVELVGTGASIQDAISEALDRAQMTFDGVTSFEMAERQRHAGRRRRGVPRRAPGLVHALGTHARMNEITGVERIVLPIGVNAVESVNCYVLADGDR